MRLKKIFITALVVATTMLLVACGGNGGSKTGPAVINNTGQQNVTHRKGAEFNPKQGITATDAVAGDVTDKIIIEGTVNVDAVGTYTLTYKITGTDGKEYAYERKIEVKEVVINGLGDKTVTAGTAVSLESGVSVIDPELGTLYASTEAHKQYFEITGEVTTTVVGSYEVVYKITIGTFEATIIRTFNVVNEATITIPGGGQPENLEYGANFNPLLNVTASMPVEREKPLQEVDDEGNLVVDENGKPVYVQKLDEDGEPMEDEDGNPIYESELDEDGNPVIIFGTANVTSYVRVDGAVNNEKTGEYVLTYKIEDPDNPLEFVKDLNGNVIEVVRTVTVYVKVEIRGVDSAITVTQGKSFSNNVEGMEGVTGYDSILGNTTSSIQVFGSVNADRAGTYTLTYLLNGSEGQADQRTRTVNVIPPITGQQRIVIMTGSLTESDPFNPNFSGTNAKERQDLHDAAEEKYNVEIVYEAYPDNAGWGPDRISAIIAASTAGKPLADIFYHVTTDWLGQLAGGGALAPIDNYLNPDGTHDNISQKFIDAGALAGNHYGFSTGSLSLDAGLYFNVDLLNELGIPNPAQEYLDGNWSWSDFKAWAVAAQKLLDGKTDPDGGGYFTLGGAIAYYGENLVPLNGGSYLDMLNGEVRFADESAMEAYDFIRELYLENLFEKNRTYDQGSAEWQAGKVLMHPGHLWFVKAENRWGGLGFELGFVPYPMADDYEGEYISPVYGSSVAYMASGHTAEKRALTFEVWNAIQQWESELDPYDAFELSLATRFDDQLYIDAYMTVYDRTYVEFLNSIGVGSYSTNSLKLVLNTGIVSGEYRSGIAAVVPVYETFLEQFMKGN